MTDENNIAETLPALDALGRNTNLVSTVPGENRLFQMDTLGVISKIAEVFSKSNLVRPHFRGPKGSEGHANTFLALSMAMEMEIPWLQALNHIHVVKGNVGFSGQLYIALANKRAPIRGRIMYKESGEGEKMICTAYAIEKETGEKLEYELKISDVLNTGWYKQNPLWKSQTKLMLRYRSAAYLVRTNFPDAMLGMQMSEELTDVHGDVSADSSERLQAKLVETEEVKTDE